MGTTLSDHDHGAIPVGLISTDAGGNENPCHQFSHLAVPKTVLHSLNRDEHPPLGHTASRGQVLADHSDQRRLEDPYEPWGTSSDFGRFQQTHRESRVFCSLDGRGHRHTLRSDDPPARAGAALSCCCRCRCCIPPSLRLHPFSRLELMFVLWTGCGQMAVSGFTWYQGEANECPKVEPVRMAGPCGGEYCESTSGLVSSLLCLSSFY